MAEDFSPETSAARRGAAEAAAADWLMVRDRGWTPAERAEFETWLGADPLHAEAWAAVEGMWTTLDRVNELAAPALAAEDGRPFWRRWGVIGGLAAAAALAVFVLRPKLPDDVRPDGAVVRVEPRVQVLADGTRVELNAGGEIDVRFAAAERRVRLLRGEVHFAVAKDPRRPFVVDARGVAISALGTAFNVQLGESEVDVLVTEGRVKVSPRIAELAAPTSIPDLGAEAERNTAVLTPRQHVRVPLQPIAAAPPVETLTEDQMSQSLSWQGLRLRFRDMPLRKVVAEFNQVGAVGRAPRLEVDDSAAHVRVEGTFRADNVEVFVGFLERGFGVAAERRSDGTILLRAAR